jgi:hypothetical protein
VSDPEERLRKVTTAIAERDHLVRVRDSLVKDIAAEEHRVQQLAKELRMEKADVDRLTNGAMSFVNYLLAGDGALAKEQREVAEAQARLVEAQGSLETLRQRHKDVVTRIGQFVPGELERELAAARAAKESVLEHSNTAVGAELRELAIRIESIDIELVPLADAVNAAVTAYNALAEIITLLDATQAPKIDTTAKRAKALAGEAQAKIAIFHRALNEIATSSFDDPFTTDPTDRSFADAWVKELFSKRTPQERMATARSSMVARIERVGAALNPLRARHDELAGRRAALIAERAKLVGT